MVVPAAEGCLPWALRRLAALVLRQIESGWGHGPCVAQRRKARQGNNGGEGPVRQRRPTESRGHPTDARA